MKKFTLTIAIVLVAIIQTLAADRFWVGGTGNWNDANKWASVTGGPGGAGIPTALDNVFFDANSFTAAGQIVTINVDAVCADMNWTGVTNNPQLAGTTARKLYIHGSLTFIELMNFSYAGEVYFESISTGRTITSAGQVFKRHVYFQGVGGYVLQDAFEQTGGFTVFLNNGTLDLNNQTFRVNIFHTYNTNVRTLYLRSSEFIITSSSSSAFYFRGENFTFDAGTSTIRFLTGGANLNHGGNYGPGLAFHNVFFEATTGTSAVSNSPGSFNLLVFNSTGSVSGGNVIDSLIYNGNGTISTNGNNINDVAFNANATIGGNGTYGKVVIAGNGTITGSNNFGTLIFSEGKSYTLTHSQNQSVDVFTANSTCAAPITIQSSSATAQTTISKTGGSVTINHCMLQGINAAGAATFTANNTVDYGNNSGWTINQPAPKNLYWVGGSGNWNDPLRWSLTTGGPTANCIPNALDNVFFDANSFSAPGQTVTIVGNESNMAYCKNMSWAGATNNPTLAGAAGVALNIHGSLALNPVMVYIFLGTLNFVATDAGHTISTAGRILDKNHIYFDGADGTWTLLDALSIGSRTLYLVKGTLNTNNQAVNVGLFDSNYTNSRGLNLGSSVMTLSSSSGSAFYFRGENFTFNAGTSLIKFSTAGGGITHNGAFGPGLAFRDVLCEAATGSSPLSNYGGSFNTLTFNSNGTITGANTINTLTFAGNGTINTNGNNITALIVNGTATINGNGTYGSVTLNGNGSITGNNTFGTLTLSAGNQYTFTASRTQTFLNDLVAQGAENQNIIIQSSTTNQTNFSKSSGTLTVNYVSLKDNNATGGATFIANNSIDLGNNTGWTINAPGGKTYYWVGGTGNWNDTGKWSLTSGGAGGAGFPSAIDNAVFDANSFNAAGQVVTLIGDASNNARVLSMDWSGATNNPTLAGASSVNLRIHGSLTLNPNMVYTFSGLVHFVATEPGQTISTAGIALDKNHLFFNGEGGAWTLQDALSIGSRTLYLERGTLNTNNQNIEAGVFDSNVTGTRAINLGSTVMTLTSSSSSAFVFRGESFSFNAGTSLIKFPTATAGLNHYLNNGPGLAFYDVIFEAATGTSSVSNSPGSFNTLTFNSAGSISGANTINTLTFAGNGTINTNGNNITNLVVNGAATINQNGNYGNVTLNGNGSVTGNNTFGTLTLSAGKNYTFTAARTQTFLNDLIAQGAENQNIIIQSSSTTQTNFFKASGTLTVNYVSLKDNNATGGANFIANNSLDLGNNTGWTINAPGGKTYYWVGGTGNWNDTGKWSLTSGGVGGAGFPSAIDNAVFDANSFNAAGQVVTLIGDASNNARVLSMDWSGATNNPTLAGAAAVNLRIHGSLTLNPNMVYSFNGPVHFVATEPGHTVYTAGISLNRNDLYFNGIGGAWTLQDDLNLGSYSLYLVNGSLNTNSKNILMHTFQSNYNGNLRTLTLGSSVITIASTSNQSMYFHGNGLTLNAGTSLFRFTGAGTGIYNISGGGLFFHNVIFEATTGTVDLYNLNGGFNSVVFMSNGTNRLRYTNTVNSVTFNGTGQINDDGNNITAAVFNGNGSILGNNTFGTLQFAPGFTYTLTAGKTQTITNELIANGNCAAFITIQSSSGTVNATVYKESGEVNVSYCYLQRITASGSATFNATNSIDLGNNTGWTFTQVPQNLYWVGGTGNWDDVNKWSATSGGAGGYCVPSQLDNVIFDQNSFTQTGQAVWINVSNAECRDMDWSAATFNPTFTSTSASNNLRIYGSLTLNPTMNFAFSGAVYFEGKTPSKSAYQITSAGKPYNNAVYFNGVGGSWTLTDNFHVLNNDIYLNHGTLNTNNMNMVCRRFITTNNNIRSLHLGSSIVTLSSTSSLAWQVTGANFTINPGTSEIVLTAQNAGLSSIGASVLSYNKVSFSNAGGTSVLNSDDTFNSVQFSPMGKIQGGGTFHDVVFNLNGEIENNNTFGSVKCFSGATIKGNNNFSRLLLGKGYIYIFQSGFTQTITGRFIIWGSAAESIEIRASGAGNIATISKATGTVLGNYVTVKDMTATGGATFNLYSSIDQGNNTGWNFLAPTSLSFQNITITPGPGVCHEATEIITLGGGGTTFTVQNGGGFKAIAGLKVSLLAGTRVFSGGHLHAMVTPYGFFCDTLSTMLASDFVAEDAGDQFLQMNNEESLFRIFPNPTTGLFTLELSDTDEFNSVTIEISNLIGERLIRQHLPAVSQYQVELSGYQPGVYLVRVIQGNQARVLKIVKQ